MNGLVEQAQEALEKMEAMLKGIGFKYKILETIRSRAKQEAYYAQGRESLFNVNEKRKVAGLPPINDKENSYTITKCDGIKIRSNHQDGKAVDIVPVIDGRIPWNTDQYKESWETLGEIGKRAGFKWGGDWGKTASKLGWDCPHFEI